MPDINTGDTAWVLMSAALVLLMTPGLAFFYGGMVRAKSVLNMMMMRFIAIGIVSILWVLFGYSMAFGDTGNGFLGGLGDLGLGELIGKPAANGGYYPIPAMVFAAFQLMFAIITVGADLRRHRRPREVRGLAGLRRPSGRPWSTSRSRTGSSTSAAPTSTASVTAGWRTWACDRLRRRHRRPHQRRRRGPGPGHRAGQAASAGPRPR